MSSSLTQSPRSHSDVVPAGRDLFNAPRKKSFPPAAMLGAYGVTSQEFSTSHNVVCCSRCEADGLRSFLMLRYVESRPGYKAFAIGARPIARGRSLSAQHGQSREMWLLAIGLGVLCDNGHYTSMHPQTGELTCIDVSVSPQLR